VNTLPSPAEENAALRKENSKLARELRLLNAQLTRVTKASEGKEALSVALSLANSRQKEYTDILLENCPNVIVLFDKDGKFVLSTQSLLHLMRIPHFDYIKNASYTQAFEKYFTKESMQIFKDAIERALDSSEAIFFDIWIDFSENSDKPQYYSIELRCVGDEKNILMVMVDLTAFMIEKQRSDAASTAKTDFLAAVSHEIRTPMNAIIGMSTALERLNLPQEYAKYVTDIQTASSSLMTIIDDILDFSKIEAGKMEIVEADYNLKQMLDHLHSWFLPSFNQKHLTLKYEISPDLPGLIHGDEKRLRQILSNLISNALKYTPKGGVTITVWCEERESCLRFDVKDTGIGIREKDIDKLFSPFEQLDLRRNHNIVGTGLGLAICHDICEMMGGKVWVKSAYGEGTTFSVKLPYVSVGDVADIVEAEVTTSFVAPNANILVVDDIDINLSVAEALLDSFEIKPDLVERGVDAIRRVQRKKYDLIFMDHMMPEMDGVETTKYIRSLGGWNKQIPIVALTANVVKGTEALFLNNKMNDVLPKPIDLNTLSACLLKWLPEHVIVQTQQ